jgi:hypothetical protein
MRRIALVCLISLLAAAARADVAKKLDLSDFDAEAMRNVDDAAKELDAALLNKDATGAVANAEFIRDSMQWTEGYFAKKDGVDNAIKWSQQGRDIAVTIAKAAGAKDYNAAYESFGDLKRTCKRCHDAYKPPNI